MKLKIKKIDDRAVIPKYQTDGAAGFDLHCIDDVNILPGESLLVGTGLSFEIESGYEVQVRPRSGLALKYLVTVLNSPGTIDSDYRGEIKVILINHSKDAFFMPAQSRIAQCVVSKVCLVDFEVVESLGDTHRGDSGFGSSGTK